MTGRPMLLLALIATPVVASSPAAWAVHDHAARAACIAAAGLTGAAVSAPLLFSDAAGKAAMLVSGRWPQARMKGRQGAMLCLFDRRTGKAEAIEAEGWTASVGRSPRPRAGGT